jgi:SnoaL-like domain
MQHISAYAVVRDWVGAVNRQDAELLVALSDPGIKVVGPRGSGYGHQLLRDWLGRAGLTLETRRAFARDDAVVLAQRGVWRSSETGVVSGEAEVASRFRVSGGRIVQYARHDDLAVALREAGLEESDEVPNLA